MGLVALRAFQVKCDWPGCRSESVFFAERHPSEGDLPGSWSYSRYGDVGVKAHHVEERYWCPAHSGEAYDAARQAEGDAGGGTQGSGEGGGSTGSPGRIDSGGAGEVS